MPPVRAGGRTAGQLTADATYRAASNALQLRHVIERVLRILLQRTAALLALPEFNVMLFAVLLNYPWEFIQSPLYAGMADQRHWDAVKTCTIAALGDGVLMVVAYWGAAWLGRNRHWIVAPGVRAMLPFLLIGVCIATAIELLAQRGWWLQQWNYSAAMPLIPGLGVGWVPVLQWVMLPPLVVGVVSRQIRGRE